MTIKRVLVPLDGSPLGDAVLAAVKQLAAAMGWEIEILRVVEAALTVPEKGSASPQGIKAAKRHLAGAVSYLRQLEPKISSRLVQGVPAQQILSDGARQDGTLIAMSTHGRSGVTRWLIGSVADKVLRGSEGPVLLVHPIATGPFGPEQQLRRIVVPLDGSPWAAQAIPQAISLALALSVPARLIQVTPSVTDYLRWQAGEQGYVSDYAQVAADIDQEAQGYLEKAMTSFKSAGVSMVSAELLHGDAASAIIDAARHDGDCLIVMTSRGRTGLPRAVLGSVADRVVRQAGSPVLLVRPD